MSGTDVGHVRHQKTAPENRRQCGDRRRKRGHRPPPRPTCRQLSTDRNPSSPPPHPPGHASRAKTPNSAHGPPDDLLRDLQHPRRPIPHRPRPHPFPSRRHLLRLDRRPQKRPPIQRSPRKLLKTQHTRRIHTLHMRPRARPSPTLRRPHQLRPHRIQFHVPQKRLKPQVAQQLRIEPRRPVRRPRAQVARPPPFAPPRSPQRPKQQPRRPPILLVQIPRKLTLHIPHRIRNRLRIGSLKNPMPMIV